MSSQNNNLKTFPYMVLLLHLWYDGRHLGFSWHPKNAVILNRVD